MAFGRRGKTIEPEKLAPEAAPAPAAEPSTEAIADVVKGPLDCPVDGCGQKINHAGDHQA